MNNSFKREMAAAYDHGDTLFFEVRSLTKTVAAQLATIAEQQAEIAQMNETIFNLENTIQGLQES